MLGYTLHQNVLNASFFGIPQRRIRWYGVAIRNDLQWTYKRPQETYEQIFLKDVLIPDSVLNAGLEANCRECKNAIVDEKTIKHIEWRDTNEYLIQVPITHLYPIGYLNGLHMQGYRIYSPLGHATTLLHRSGGVGSQTSLYWINGRLRRLHVLECKRIQGYPDDFPLSVFPRIAIGQLGNAVIPEMVKRVFEGIQGIEENYRDPFPRNLSPLPSSLLKQDD